MTQDRRSAAVAIGLSLLVAAMLGGCAVFPAQGTGDGAGGRDAAPVTNQFALVSQAAVTLQPAWQLEYDRPVVAALAEGGGFVLVGRSYGSIRNSTNWSAIAYTADGTKLWEQSYAEVRYRAIEVAIIGRAPYFAVSVFGYEGDGRLYVYSAPGDLLWSRSVDSSVTLRADAAGNRIVGIDRGAKVLFIVDAQTGAEVATVAVSLDAAIQVAATGHILVTDPASAVRLDPTGRVLASVADAPRYAAIELAQTGDALFATTGGADSSVYRYAVDGKLVWQVGLQVGGSNNLTISADGRYVVAYNVGLGHGLVLLDAASGRVLATTAVDPVAGAASQFVEWVRFLPAAKGLLVNLVVSRDPGGALSEEHNLIWLSTSGAYQGHYRFGANSEVLVTADGRTALVVDTVAQEQQTPSVNQVRAFSLARLYER